jgi:hypothetical protein
VKTTTQEHLNRIIDFRQAIHENGFGKQRDALMETLDALCITGAPKSFPMLSLCKLFHRQWHSLYKAIERGTLNETWLSGYLAQEIPQEGVQYYALDGSAWPRPRARTMDDRQYVYHPTPAVNGGSICVGYPYSLLDWVPDADQSWSLPLSVKRIPSEMSAVEMGIRQVKELSENRTACQNVLDIVAADGKYGNAKFLRPLQEGHCGIVVRLRRDRVLCWSPEQPQKRKRGRPRIHGRRFAFKEQETWGEPDETIFFEHHKFGQVKLDRWNGLHGKKDADVPFDVIRACTHLERDNPPNPLWLAWQAPKTIPDGLQVDAKLIWLAYVHRWPVEPGIRFRKQRLGWTTPQFQHKESGDLWSWVVALALWLLYLSRPIVKDWPLPWQKPQSELTPQRVQQSLPLIFWQFGSPARQPKMRGKPPGWPKGKRRTPKQRYKAVKKQPATA